MLALSGTQITVVCQARERTGAASVLRADIRAGDSGQSVVGGAASIPVPANLGGYAAIAHTFTISPAAVLGDLAGLPVYLIFPGNGVNQINIDQVEASALIPPPSVSHFAATPNPLQPGQVATLRWSAEAAETVLLDGVPVPASGERRINPAAETTFTLEVANAQGSASAQATVQVAPPGLRISEFLADNATGILDGFGQRSDWIEVENTSGAPIDLSGYRLTDDRADLAKWHFPEIVLGAGERLIVFASGQAAEGVRDPQGNPHANFRLDAGGEYLALIAPDGQAILSEFCGGWSLAPDQSYGWGVGSAHYPVVLLEPGSAMRYLVPGSAVGDGWRGGAVFDDSGWAGGAFEAGFDTQAFPIAKAYSIAGGTAGNQNYGGSLGMDFDASAAIEITELGCFDDGSNGIAAGTSITVQIWERSGNLGTAMLAQETFTSASPGALEGGQRFKALAAPVAVPPGNYTVVAYGYGNSERNGNGAGFSATDGNGGLISFVGSSRFGTAGAFPGTPDGGPAARYGAGTFKFRGAGSAFPTDLESEMAGVSASAFFRAAFDLDEPPGRFGQLVLNIKADDGFVAWLNGVEVARRNAPAALAHDSAATAAADEFSESIDLAAFSAALAEGENILAIHGLNVSAGDSDFRIGASLSADTLQAALRYFTAPTPGVANTAGGSEAGHIVISEIHYDPPDSKSRDLEFVELFNPLDAAVDVGGWTLGGGVEFAIPGGTILPPNGYLVIAEDAAEIALEFGVAALGPWSGNLANEGEEIVLRDALGNAVDRVDYELGFPWPTVGDEPAMTIQKIGADLDPSLGGSWRSALPTPGAPNGAVARAYFPPAIRQVDHAPKAPRSGEDVVVTAKITDCEGVGAATLLYQIVEPGAYLRQSDGAYAANWLPVAMADDGVAPDLAAGDDIFTGAIPGAVQAHRRLIRYRILAADGQGTEVRVPYDDDPSPNFAYFVYDGVPAWTAAVQPGVTPADTFDAAAMGSVRPWHVLADGADILNFRYNGAFNDGTYRFEGTLVIGGEVYDHIRFRPKGQNSTYNTGKIKWKIKFPRGHYLDFPDDYGQPYDVPVRTLNLSSISSPWAAWNRGMAGLDEAVSYRLSTLAGAPAPCTSYAHLRVVDAAEEDPDQFNGDLWGLYLAFGNQDNQFKEQHGLPDGNIFRMQRTRANRLLGQGEGEPDDLSDLNAFVSNVTGYNLGTAGNVATIQPEQWWRDHVHLEEYFSWRAVTEAVNNTDRRDQENVVYFREPGPSGRWMIFPWDNDLLYEQFDRWGPEGTQTAGVTPYEQIERCLLHPAIDLEFRNRARELQDLLLNDDQGWTLVDEYAAIITGGGAGTDGTGFAEIDRRRWDYDPANPVPPRSAGAFGNYYKTPYPIGNMTNGPIGYSRVLDSPDFAGMVAWVKDFIAADAHGGGRLAQMAADATIPATPALTDGSAPGHPANAIALTSSAFVPGDAGRAFAAMEWRIGEVYDPSVAGYEQGTPYRYEIEPVWESGELASFEASIAPPPVLVPGRTYRARVRHQDGTGRWSHWSAPLQFTASAPDVAPYRDAIAITELHYHPADAEGEFLEIANLGAAALDLAPLRFADGIDFDFSGASVAQLGPGERLVIVRNLAAFQAAYPSVPASAIAGEYGGALNDGGENLALIFGAETIVREFAFDDAAPWPGDFADGGGRSIVQMSPQADDAYHADGTHWRYSAADGGSPGESDAAPPPVDHDDLIAYAFGESGGIAYSAGGGGIIEIRLTQRLDADAIVLAETSGNLTDWEGVAILGESESIDGNTLTRTLTVEALPGPTRFIRGKVVIP
ncbi:MAG: lamin tail domain-containing protein [Verrucomicrobiales bacterium]